KGVFAALSSAAFLGISPVFGKLAINLGFSPLAVTAFRSGLAAGLIFLVMLLFFRSYLYIYPVGLIGCFLAGAINGLGSILYYMALERLDASVGQTLYLIYPFFVAIWLILDRQPPSRLTLYRMGIAGLSLLLITTLPSRPADPIGIVMMLGAAALYALHLPINQRVLYEVPAPTVTLYTLIAMSIVVLPAYLLFDRQWITPGPVWWPVIGLTVATLLSRLSLFLGVKHIGGLQTALLGLSELLVTILFSYLFLKENLAWTQWLGAAGLGLSLLLVQLEEPRPVHDRGQGGWLSWIRPPDLPRDIPADIPWGPHE
ncbi:MAG TPA: DMT family transporter, partial [Anaerolineales bacterium]|nr:DMT family transporter [Anaerolineales bacterium]